MRFFSYLLILISELNFCYCRNVPSCPSSPVPTAQATFHWPLASPCLPPIITCSWFYLRSSCLLCRPSRLPATVSFSLIRIVSSLVSLPFNLSSGNSPSTNLKVTSLKSKSDSGTFFLKTISTHALLHVTFMQDASSPSLRPAALFIIASPSPGPPARSLSATWEASAVHATLVTISHLSRQRTRELEKILCYYYSHFAN